MVHPPTTKQNNMQLSIKNIVGIAVIALLLAVGFALQTQQTSASVAIGNGYNARQVTSSTVGTSSVSSQFAIVGSVVVSSTSPVTTAGPYIAFYDTASTTIATTSMTAKFSVGSKGGTTPPAGTYTYDVEFGQGIYMWVDPSFNGSYTVTYR